MAGVLGLWSPDPGRIWYGSPNAWSAALLPLSWLYCGVALGRRLAYQRGWLSSVRLPVPVIVVGNISVGGTGKTPLVLWLANWLQAQGGCPGILTRGYGGQARDWPLQVFPDSDPDEVGDEPVLLARRAGCPVVAGPDRITDGLRLVKGLGCDVLISDDGLQHYQLRRDLEIATIDALRGLGNQRCLPAGPLREPPKRLTQVGLVVLTGTDGQTQIPVPGHRLDLVPGDAINLADPEISQPLAAWRGRPLTAVAGIGNPGRFFGLLRAAGLDPLELAYPDHHPFRAAEAAAWGEGEVLMTEKDAVKCAGLARPNHWYLPVEARPEPSFVTALEQRLEGLIRGQKAAGHSGLPPV